MKGRERSRLKVLRAVRDVTQTQLARATGINVTRYWHIENGEGLPASKDEREAIATALNVKVADIAWPLDEPAAQKAKAS